MKNSPPNRDNSARIIQYFKETTRYRRALLEKKELTITDMVKEIPRLQDMPELVIMRILVDVSHSGGRGLGHSNYILTRMCFAKS